jgi:S1-C subfamily serine protease
LTNLSGQQQQQQQQHLELDWSRSDHDIVGTQDLKNIDVDEVLLPKRRILMQRSAAAFFSALLATTTGTSRANAGSLAVLEDSENRRIDIFERNAPSVVFIDTFAEKQDVFSPNVMEVPLGTGSGFVWDKQGHIVTNYHVVRNAKFAQVALITPRKGTKESIGLLSSQQQQQLSPQASSSAFSSTNNDSDTSSLDVFSVSPSAASRSTTTNKFSSAGYKRSVFKATVIGADPGKDIAVLKIDAPQELLYPISVGKSAGLKVGQLSLAIGNPFGLDHSLTSGVISGLGREVRSPIGRPITNVIQVTRKREKGEFQLANLLTSFCFLALGATLTPYHFFLSLFISKING